MYVGSSTLRPATGSIARNPILLVIAALFGVSQLPNLLIQPTRLLLAPAISLATMGLLIAAVAIFHLFYRLFSGNRNGRALAVRIVVITVSALIRLTSAIFWFGSVLVHRVFSR